VVAEKFDAAESYSLLQMGAKGLLSYDRGARTTAARAAAGGRGEDSGFPAPCFPDLSIRPGRIAQPAPEGRYVAADLSRREQEVLNSLLENLANKEIGNKLNISERTVKFHVSNLLKQVRSPPPGRSHSALLPKAQLNPLKWPMSSIRFRSRLRDWQLGTGVRGVRGIALKRKLL
jgi:DNA-binding CsgD family transcriptional regulator